MLTPSAPDHENFHRSIFPDYDCILIMMLKLVIQQGGKE
jgi:hypothetical protein